MAMLNPNLLKGSGQRSLESITALVGPGVHDHVASGFRGEIGKQALEELQDIRKNNREGLKTLQKSDQPINMAQLGMLTGKTDSPLMKVLSKMPEEKRVAALNTFGKSMTPNEQELLETMLEAS